MSTKNLKNEVVQALEHLQNYHAFTPLLAVAMEYLHKYPTKMTSHENFAVYLQYIKGNSPGRRVS